MAGIGTGIIDLGMNQSSFAGGQFVGDPYTGGQFAGGQGIVSFGGQGLGFRRAQNASVDSHYMPWAPSYPMERLICAGDPTPGTAVNGVNPMAGPVPVLPTGPESLAAGPGGSVIPTPELAETVQPSVAEAAALAGQQPEAAALIDVAQQPALPVDAAAPQLTAEQAAAAAAQQAAAPMSAPAPQQADPAPQQAAEQAGAPAPQMDAPAPQQGASQAEAATVTTVTEPVVDSAAEVLAPVSDAVAEGTTATVGAPVAGASMDSTQLIAAS